MTYALFCRVNPDTCRVDRFFTYPPPCSNAIRLFELHMQRTEHNGRVTSGNWKVARAQVPPSVTIPGVTARFCTRFDHTGVRVATNGGICFSERWTLPRLRLGLSLHPRLLELIQQSWCHTQPQAPHLRTGTVRSQGSSIGHDPPQRSCADYKLTFPRMWCTPTPKRPKGVMASA